jgi:hypothetical protein
MDPKTQEPRNGSNTLAEMEHTTPSDIQPFGQNPEGGECDSPNHSQGKAIPTQEPPHSHENIRSTPSEQDAMFIGDLNAQHQFSPQQNKLLQRERQRSAKIQQESDEWRSKFYRLRDDFSSATTNADFQLSKMKTELRSLRVRGDQKEQEIRKHDEEFRRILDTTSREKQQEIDRLKNQNSELATQVFSVVGQAQYATIDQMRLLMTDWYHESANFCQEFFDPPDVNNKEHQAIIRSGAQWQLIKDVITDMFYYFVQGIVMRHSYMSACEYGLSGGIDGRDATGKQLLEALTSLDRATMNQSRDNGNIGKRLLFQAPSRD